MLLKYFVAITAFSNILYLDANAKAEIVPGSRKIFLLTTIYFLFRNFCLFADYENCTEVANNLRADVIDISQLKIHTENDTHSFLNGSLKFQRGFDVLPGRFYAEKFDRGQWFIQAYDRSYPDLCSAFHDPTQPFYNYCKHFPMCPQKTGVSYLALLSIKFKKLVF